MNRSRDAHQPAWQRPRDLDPAAGPPAALRAWLLDPGSLTAHLRGRFGDDLAVAVLAEGDEIPTAAERDVLDLNDPTAFVRRVALQRRGFPLVLARTVMPTRTLSGEGERLRRLGDTPLGELVFADFAATRSGFELARLAPPTKLFPELHAECWARRSVLTLATGPILVTEAFLPALLEEGGERS